MAMTLGAQLYTVRQFTKTPEGIEETLRKIKAMGFKTIQISGFGPMDPHKLADLVHELDLYVCVTHSPFARMQEDLPALIEEHRLLGCDTIGLGSMPKQYQTSAEGFRQFVKDITPIAHAIKEAGMQFAYHNHNFEFQRFNGELGMDILFNETVPEEFHFILDTYWLQMGGVNPPDYIRRAKDRMKVCHFKDFRLVDLRTPAYSEVGLGNLDLHECYRACRDAGVKDIVIEQDTCDGDPFDSLAISFKNLKQIAADEEA